MRLVVLLVSISGLMASLCGAGDIVDPHSLQAREAYHVSAPTPLLLGAAPAAPAGASPRVRQIPAGGAFKIYGVKRADGKAQYQVRAIGPDKKTLGSGTIESSALVGQTLTPYGGPPTPAEPGRAAAEVTKEAYKIVSSQDRNYKDRATWKTVRRKEYRVRLHKGLTAAELKRAAEEIVSRDEASDAVVILFYLPGSDPAGEYTAGKATWAPNGKWEDAARPDAKKLVVEVGAARRRIPRGSRP